MCQFGFPRTIRQIKICKTVFLFSFQELNIMGMRMKWCLLFIFSMQILFFLSHLFIFCQESI